jgi:chemotaxis protein CheD
VWLVILFKTPNQSILACEQELVPLVTVPAEASPDVEEIRVDMADMKVESKPAELLTSVGSCVAICIHDPIHKCGGLAHIMLPKSANSQHEPVPSKFADTAVPALMNEVHKISGKQNRLSAKIAGGANMFANLGTNHLDIGAKNIKAVKTALDEYRISLIGEDVGGLHGRKVSFNVVSGITVVRSFNGEIKKI